MLSQRFAFLEVVREPLHHAGELARVLARGHARAVDLRKLARELRERLREAVAGEDVAPHRGEHLAHRSRLGLVERRAERARHRQAGGEQARELARGERELRVVEARAEVRARRGRLELDLERYQAARGAPRRAARALSASTRPS